MKKKLALLAALAMMLSFALAACATNPPAEAPAGETQPAAEVPVAERYGGVLKVSMNQDPVSLDALLEGGENEQIPAAHIFETALALDKSGNAFPGVCEYTFDGTTLTLKVREGVTFHNGDAVEIADVDASMTRWLTNVSFARTHFGDKIATREIVGDELVVTLSGPAPLALTALGRYAQGLYIMQEEICVAKPDTKIAQEEYIGTGPYKFVEHLADRYVRVERYDAYVPTNAEADGRAAPKMAYVDEIYFYPVPDRTARITGVQTGEYDVAIGVPANMMAELSASEDLVVEVKDLGIMAVMVFNSNQGLGTDVNLRKAILACVDM
ncbi:MAG: ABC transporter substrate-binding protein, partial [Clostridiales bacterium]|nr:ABC transporter substrate-binding protein [Clostridiales bacterium]